MNIHTNNKVSLTTGCLLSRFWVVAWIVFCTIGYGADYTSNQITGTVRFSNANPAILALLNPPGNEGMSNLIVFATSVPAGLSGSSTTLPATTPTATSYSIDVDGTSTGIAYSLEPRVYLLAGAEEYHFTNNTSAPVVSGAPGPVLDFSECLGLVRLSFRDTTGTGVPVAGGIVDSERLSDYSSAARLLSIPANTMQQDFYVPSGVPVALTITVYVGTSFYSDKDTYVVSTNLNVACDQVTNITVTLPAVGSLGQVTGTVHMAGQFEWSVPVQEFIGTQVGSVSFTGVAADNGPFQNRRWAALGGDNATIPSSGTFHLVNVVPSTLDASSQGYQVRAEMMFGTNRTIEGFQTPGLGSGSNPALVVTPGATVDLTNLFVINPGHVRGGVLLQGPPETPDHPSLLRGVVHAGDDDANHDGIPDEASTYGVYDSFAVIEGVDSLAAGARFTAAGGRANGDFTGSFDSVTSSYRGNYDLLAGGLAGQASVWRPSYLTLKLQSDPSSNGTNYYSTGFQILDQRGGEFTVTPAQPVVNDLAYCFGEVQVRFRSPNANFWLPTVMCNQGSFSGTDFQGRSGTYLVQYFLATASPGSLSGATNTALLTTYLPAGEYDLSPSVIAASSGDQVGLPTFHVSVGCSQYILVDPVAGLQVQLNAQPCAATAVVPISGTVTGTNAITSVTLSVNGGPPVTLCAGCGLSPHFATNVSITATPCATTTITVAATDIAGNTASTTASVLYSTQAPIITQCPGDMAVPCAGPPGTTVQYSGTAVSECGGQLAVSFTPPSGSLFQPGTHPVTGAATDACGRQSAACTFNVTVLDTTPPVINCPTGIVVDCASQLGAPVSFTVTATDNCDTNISIVCAPPSGSVFGLGTNTVLCTARDSSGNTNQCTFSIIVRPEVLTITRTVTIEWCGGALQGADSVNGPWADIPGAASPYTVAADKAKQFYRARQ